MKLLGLSQILRKTYRFVGSVKFAISILSVFAFSMIVGTFVESRFGGEFARRTVYHTWWFYLEQLLIAASILFAMLMRFPFKQRLIGFYLIHTALLTVFGGSIVTRYWGIDGSIELVKGRWDSSVQLGDDVIYLNFDGRQHHFPLPYAAHPTKLQGIREIRSGASIAFERYIPFAKLGKRWSPEPGAWFTEWNLKNDRFSQNVELFKHSGQIVREQLGPLTLALVDIELIDAVRELDQRKKLDAAALVLFDSQTKNSYTLSGTQKSAQSIKGTGLKFYPVERAKARVSFFELLAGSERVQFFPRFSPKPVDKSTLQADLSSRWSLLEVGAISAGATVLIGRRSQDRFEFAFGKPGMAWQFSTQAGSAIGKSVDLPWMGFRLTLEDERLNERFESTYVPGEASTDDEKNIRAVLLSLNKGGSREEMWLTSNLDAESTSVPGVRGFIGRSRFELPFQMSLAEFKMDMVPGMTDKPASFESFVDVRNPDVATPSRVHIFMNNPYKSSGFTFYQSSYLKGDDGQYHTILSVNRDPGRPIKYAGSLLLVLGLILHFMILYRQKRSVFHAS